MNRLQVMVHFKKPESKNFLESHYTPIKQIVICSSQVSDCSSP